MPLKGQTDTAKKVIDKAVKRHLEGGETIASLAKELKVSRQTVYSWVNNFKQEVMEGVERAGASKTDLERTAKAELVAQVEMLALENRKLRDRLVTLMIKYREIP
jgi:transposase-like protein